MKWLDNLIAKWTCLHQWKLERSVRLKVNHDFGNDEYDVHTYICVKCGKFTKIKSS